VASSLVDEFALIVGTATALGLGLWTWAVAGPLVGVLLLIAATAAVIVALSRLDQLVALALRFVARAMPEGWRNAAEEMHRAADDPGLGLKASALFTGGYLLTNFLLSVAFVLIVLSLSDIAMEDLPLLLGGYSLSAVLGIVVFFAPAGLGVREGVVAGFLTPVVGGPMAASLAILVRLAVVLTDVVFLALIEGSSALSRLAARNPRPAARDDPDHLQSPADPPRG